MEKTNLNKKGVIGIIDEAREFIEEIGKYREHFINARFGYTVSLTNGKIEMPIRYANQYQKKPGSIDKSKIKKIAQSFKADTYKEYNKIS